MLDVIGLGFDVPKHHGGSRSASQLVPGPVNLEPLFGQTLVPGDGLADPVPRRISAPPPGKLPMPASFGGVRNCARGILLRCIGSATARGPKGVQIGNRW